ncbi:MAG: alpha-hydroxy-acid oxidizing protein, partial [Rhodocyclaceae bacterium]|nr:alpha-hydroxy-acid oxidizing protein [Rhodocyclaceae bacterium]
MTDLQIPAPALSHIPRDILCAADYAVLARRFIAPPAYAYIAGGAGEERTLADNVRAFARWQIRPRLLHDVTAGHTRVELLGHRLAHPLLLAPVAYQALAHPGGERESARGAAAADAC